MIEQKKPVLVMRHPSARPEAIWQSQELLHEPTLKGITRRQEIVFNEAFFRERFPDEVTTIVVFGGDGTVRTVLEKVLKEGVPRVLIVGGGGSQNAFYDSLLFEADEYARGGEDARNTLEPRNIGEAANMDVRKFYPGQVNKNILINNLEFGRTAGPFAILNESLRDSLYPRGARMPLAAGRIGLREAGKGKVIDEETGEREPLLRLFFTSRYFKERILFPNQSLYSNDMTMVTIAEKDVKEMIVFAQKFFSRWRQNKLPSGLYGVETAPVITVDIPSPAREAFSIGGDVFTMEPRQRLVASRTTESVQTAALVMPAERRTRRG